MGTVRELLRVRPWGLSQSRMLAREIAGYKPSLRALVHELFGEEVALRKRAADVARRITDQVRPRSSVTPMSWRGCWSRCRLRSRRRAGIWRWWSRASRIPRHSGCAHPVADGIGREQHAALRGDGGDGNPGAQRTFAAR